MNWLDLYASISFDATRAALGGVSQIEWARMDKERAEFRNLALRCGDSLGFPRVCIRRAEHVVGDPESWGRFTANADIDDLADAMLAMDGMKASKERAA